MAKKISLVVEDTVNKTYVKIPVSSRELNDWYGLVFLLQESKSFERLLIINNYFRSFRMLHKKCAKLLDATNEGHAYKLIFKKNKLTRINKRVWCSGKPPVWKKIRKYR